MGVTEGRSVWWDTASPGRKAGHVFRRQGPSPHGGLRWPQGALDFTLPSSVPLPPCVLLCLLEKVTDEAAPVLVSLSLY